MLQEKLNGLAILCIEKHLLVKLDFITLISQFASKKARRITEKKKNCSKRMNIRGWLK
jgi:hypothetical protein